MPSSSGLSSLRLLLLALLALCTAPARAAAPGLCLYSCQNCLRRVQFQDVDAELFATAQSCHSRLGLASLYLCMDVYCSEGARDKGLEMFNATCKENFGEPALPWEIVEGYTEEDVMGMRRLEMDELPSELLREPALPSATFFGLWFGTLDSVEYVRSHHNSYGWAMGIFWAVVVAIGMVFRLLSTLSHSHIILHADRRQSSWTWAFVAWVRRRFLVPATFGYRCAQNVGWCTIPPRVQTLTIAAFVAMNVVFSVTGYRFFEGNIYFPTFTKELLRYLSDRTGIISFANFPVIWLFGMRNNVVIWLTGWDFGTYNNFHRWVARVATLQAVIHSIGYSALILHEGGWPYFASWWTIWFWWAGEIATVAMCALVAFSFYWIRRQQYELFLILHIVLSIIVLLTMLGHVSIFNGQYDAMFWAPAFIWMLDRLLRTCRILVFNPKVWDTRALATYDPSSNIVRLTIPTQSSAYSVSPGTHFYLMVLNDKNFWESHPFTVASLSSNGKNSAKTFDEQEAPLLGAGQVEIESADAEDSGTPEHGSTEMSFLIRPYDDFTLRLKERAEAEWPQPASMRVLVDGPYGHTRPFHLFDHVVFVVGGSGVVVPLSYLRRLATSHPRPRSVDIHWAVREPGFAAGVLREDCGELLEYSHISMNVYITSSGHSDVPALPEQVRWRNGRLDPHKIVSVAADTAGNGSVAVIACGPARVADDTRQAVVETMGRGTGWIEYFEESFSW